jgi:hypothetical protein
MTGSGASRAIRYLPGAGAPIQAVVRAAHEGPP